MAIGAYHGFRRGFVLEIVSLLALILGVLGGFHLLHWGISMMDKHFHLIGKFIPLLSFVVIFVGIILLVNILGKVVSKIIHMALLGGVDKVGGAIFGFLKWGFMLSIALWLISVFSLPLPEHLKEGSRLYPYISAIAPEAAGLFGKILPATSDLFERLSELVSFAS